MTSKSLLRALTRHSLTGFAIYLAEHGDLALSAPQRQELHQRHRDVFIRVL